MHKIYEQGYSVYDVVNTIHKVLLSMEGDIRKDRLFEMLKEVALLKKRVLDGLTSEIQLAMFLARCTEIDSSS